jgi:hypothetical protein
MAIWCNNTQGEFSMEGSPNAELKMPSVMSPILRAFSQENLVNDCYSSANSFHSVAKCHQSGGFSPSTLRVSHAHLIRQSPVNLIQQMTQN